MSLSIFDKTDPKVIANLESLIALQKASLKWRWRLLAITVAIAAVVGAVFQVLNYAIP